MPWIRACATSADGHSLFGGDPLPWLQLEMSRALYLAPPWFDWGDASARSGRSGSFPALREETGIPLSALNGGQRGPPPQSLRDSSPSGGAISDLSPR